MRQKYLTRMKVIQMPNADFAALNDQCTDKNPPETSNQHKLNEIQDLLKAHNNPIQDER